MDWTNWDICHRMIQFGASWIYGRYCAFFALKLWNIRYVAKKHSWCILFSLKPIDCKSNIWFSDRNITRIRKYIYIYRMSGMLNVEHAFSRRKKCRITYSFLHASVCSVKLVIWVCVYFICTNGIFVAAIACLLQLKCVLLSNISGLLDEIWLWSEYNIFVESATLELNWKKHWYFLMSNLDFAHQSLNE